MTDSELIDAYASEQLDRGLSPASVACRCQRSLRSLADRMHPSQLLEATRSDIDEWLVAKGLSIPRGRLHPRTRYWHLSNLSCFFRWCIESGHLELDPTHGMVRPRLPRLLPRPMRRNDLEHALAVASPRMRAWLSLAAYCGLRAKEIAGLRRENVVDDADVPVILVEHGKGDRQRVVPLHPLAREALLALELPESGWLWPGKYGALQAHSVSTYVATFLRGLGIQATAHRGRHYFGTEVYRVSGDLLLTQYLLGHASPTTTLIYVEWDQSKAADVVARIGRAAPASPSVA